MIAKRKGQYGIWTDDRVELAKDAIARGVSDEEFKAITGACVTGYRAHCRIYRPELAKKKSFWTDEELARGRELYGTRMGDQEFLAAVGHTRIAFIARRRLVEGKGGFDDRKHNSGRSNPGGAKFFYGRPSVDLIAEAQARSNAPRTLSAAILGDPPAGYSALDKKRAAYAIADAMLKAGERS